MRILYFAPHPLGPLTTGGRLRDYHLARELSRYAEMTFLELQSHRSAELAGLPDTTSFAHVLTLARPRAYTPLKILRGLLGPHSLTALNYGSPALRSHLRKALTNLTFDSIQVENVHLLSCLPVLRDLYPAVPIVADWHNIESELMDRYAAETHHPARKLVARRTAKLLAREETQFLSACNAHTVTSRREKERLQLRCPGKAVAVVPNGVDTSEFPLHNSRESEARRKRLLFVGSMDYHANVDAVQWFVRNVWPGLTSLHSEVELTVVGRNPPKMIQNLAGPRITVTGEVKKVVPFYQGADIAIVPLRVGSGTRLKILEAMAAGVPVVSTSLGAEGLDLQAGQHFLKADGAMEMTQILNKLLNDATLGEGMAQAARAYVVQHYEWQAIGKCLFNLHQSLDTNSIGGAR